MSRLQGGRVTYQGGSTYDFLLIRYHPNGNLDTSFGNGGFVITNQNQNDAVVAVTVQSNGKIVMIGNTNEIAFSHGVIFRYNSDGSFDNSLALFLTFPNTIYTYIRAFAKLSNDQMLLAGNSNTATSQYEVLALLDREGQLVSNFGQGGRVTTPPPPSTPYSSYVTDVKVLPNGNIITAGERILRYLPNGTLDTSFPEGYGSVSKIISLPDGRLAAIGAFYVGVPNGSPGYRLKILRDSRGTIALDKANYDYYAGDILYQSNGKIVLIGSRRYDVPSGSSFALWRYDRFTSIATRQVDFDGDGRTDFAIFRSASQTLYLFLLNSGLGIQSFPTGLSGLMIPEDYDGNFKSDIVIWQAQPPRGSQAFYSPNASYCASCSLPGLPWGVYGDIPVGGDYDGDLKSEPAVFRDGVWYVRRSSNQTPLIVQWGVQGDKPVPDDYDFDGITDFAVYRPSTGVWYVLKSSDGGLIATQFGLSTDIPVAAHYDADGKSDFAVYRLSEGRWYILQSTDGLRIQQFGLNNDIPVPGDYDGDGRADIGVYRQGTWYLLQSTDGFKGFTFGAANDIPLSIGYTSRQ